MRQSQEFGFRVSGVSKQTETEVGRARVRRIYAGTKTTVKIWLGGGADTEGAGGLEDSLLVLREEHRSQRAHQLAAGFAVSLLQVSLFFQVSLLLFFSITTEPRVE